MNTELNGKRIFYAILPIAIFTLFYGFNLGSTFVLWLISAFFLFALIDPLMQKLQGKGINPIFLAIALVLGSTAILSGLGFLLYKTSSGLITQLMFYKKAIFKVYENASNNLNHFNHQLSQPQDLHQAANSVASSAQDTAHAVNQAASPAQAAASPVAEAAQTANQASGTQHVASALQNGAKAVASGANALPNNSTEASSPSVSTSEVGKGVINGLNSVFSVLSFMVLTPLLTFFMVAERDQFGMVASQVLEKPETGKVIWKQITDAITAYFVGNVVLILVSFPVFVLAFALLHVKSFLSLGLLSAIMNLIPFLGFILAAILPTLDLLLNGGHIGGALGLVGVCFITHFTVANVITPKLLGAKLDLNATFSTIALIGWGELWGPMGLLLAIPVTALIKIAFQHSGVPAFQTMASLMSEDPKSLQKRGMDLVSDRLRLKQKPSVKS
jgi:predicted PurR-regulated permease PerM